MRMSYRQSSTNEFTSDRYTSFRECLHMCYQNVHQNAPPPSALFICQIYRQELTPFPVDKDNFCLRHSPPPR